MKLLNKSYLRAKEIKLIIFDVDGVLTDGGLYFSDDGQEFKRFNSLDGLGIKILKDNGIEPAIITARQSTTVEHRMKNLGIEHFYQGQEDKVVAFNDLLDKLSLNAEQVAYMGDDVIDLPVMTKVGLPIAVSNAHELVKEKSCIVTDKIGGHGAVREVCDFILKAQDKFDGAMNPYLE
ncbi:MAG: 3-deoxy-manno-octulosonate-8-phosphatase KdsC [Candidatus Thioglobus sp.]|jgi:3-deoxy-D-manno-octulosonate 8-phosphate phosphatase (KDO 8-P phosphatase)|uniref:3-deoxy-manno-octulosonate-8-phosphatase KdsC n=1 Tax=Candidatus Thioglobus sp. TaxID=2026721 RepID=UPI0001BD372E|nr:3-deoxy-manno-octulosonate-8-phosphatase KdsC [Candidatus Thioglobus sp.]EEZ80223.1 MAG: 3-deoxy-D-manno-octulosonate 8-phosphate phosphatase [uncultured Candidatus Thioglobus sp.]MBT3187174.1 3-deoxy-manno-octulosonate-8-phosphatase KdsC [Candidatus Thioglobus sp.]MBT3431926.1 3-deoxy-manno-octulosonate-8-phosphatase KdsC [Candidatus Thioglobus sp.]MBT3965788.1 3-deoxy-manno-octulosonate-8-phosphatase KdsC [Candidatus Thioglobus sp.]MBT4315912.1 3-deoxy-manno-octulosonate-8-phosphatase Kds